MSLRRDVLKLVGLLSTCLFAGCFGGLTYEIETNSIHISEPKTLMGDYNASIGNMGIPLYGATLLGKVFYVSRESEMCKDFDPKFTANWARSELPIIVLVKRGSCYFLEKALRAQKAGADAVVIYNNIKSSHLVTMIAPSNSYVEEFNNLSIPTAFITKDLGDKIVRSIEILHQEVIMELDWRPSIFNPDDRVEWEFWYSSYNGCSNTSYSCLATQKFFQSFQEIGGMLENSETTQFTPHFLFSKCNSVYRGQVYCKSSCIKGGRYCGTDYIVSAYRSYYTKKDVSWQNVRHMCAYQVAQIDSQNAKWWKFAAEFAKQCTMAARNYTDECAENMLKIAGIDVEDVRTCMGGIDDDKDFPLIQTQLDARFGNDNVTRGYITMLPTLVINEEQYKGRLDNNGVLRAICAGFEQGSEPEMCLSSNIQQDDCTYDQEMCWSEGDFSACVDTYRGHICKCPNGFQGDGKEKCEDIDECKTKSHGCEHECENTLGGYKCKCRSGYVLYGGDNSAGICIPINPCVYNNGGCEDVCIVKSPGKAICACAPGLHLTPDNHTCDDVDECKAGTHTCEQICTNKDPRVNQGIKYSCSCEEENGFIVDSNNSSACIKTQKYLQKTGMGEEAKKSGKEAIKIVVIVLAVGIITLPAIGYILYRVYIKEQLRRQVVDVMALYMPLNEENIVKSDTFRVEGSEVQIKQVESSSNDENI